MEEKEKKEREEKEKRKREEEETEKERNEIFSYQQVRGSLTLEERYFLKLLSSKFCTNIICFTV